MTKEYIERDVALEIISDIIHDEKTYRKVRAIRRRMENTPAADVVEVVRCKDCAYYSLYERACTYENGPILGVNHGEGYCSYGERRECV